MLSSRPPHRFRWTRKCLQCRSQSTAPRIPPFTAATLSEIRSRLSPTFAPGTPLPAHTVQFVKRPASEAAIMIPLMNINNEPHVLMEVRATNMRSHGGEISFPGGKIDPEDASITAAALRETHEELGIRPENVEVLGMLDGPEYSLGNRARVWAVVGFIHDTPNWATSEHPYDSAPISALVPSPQEVAAILPFPLKVLHEESRRRLHHFRVDPRKPYYKFRAEDLVHGGAECGKRDELELWGLTGWFFNRLAWRLGWMERPKPEVYDG